MAKPKLYLETTIPSYLTARPSRDLVTAAHQQLTHEWWDRDRERYDLVVSELVLTEAARGNQEIAAQRLSFLENITTLPIPSDAEEISSLLLRDIPLPIPAAEADALHLAIAIKFEIEYVLTWNCRHLAQGQVRRRLAMLGMQRGWFIPQICTPEELSDADRTLDRPDR